MIICPAACARLDAARTKSQGSAQCDNMQVRGIIARDHSLCPRQRKIRHPKVYRRALQMFQDFKTPDLLVQELQENIVQS
jgi:hypothetical protein